MKLYGWLFLLLLFPVAAFGENSVLSLGQAISLALSANPDLALVEQQRNSAELSVAAAQGRYQPTLQASSSLSENYQHDPPAGSSEDSRSASLQLSANLNLFNGFADRATLDGADRQLQAAQADLLRQRETLIYDVASRFVDSVIAGELVLVAEQSLANEQAQQKQIEAFQQSGVRTLADLYQQQAATAQANYQLSDARRNLETSRLQLLQLLGVEQPTSLQLRSPDPAVLEPSLNDLTLDQLLARALSDRGDLQAQQQRIAAAREQTRVARAGALPTLDLQASTGSSYSSLSDGGVSEQLGEDNLNSSLMLKLAIPIFDRDQTRTQVAQAHLDELSAKTRLAKLRQQLLTQLGQTLADYQAALAQRFSANQQLQAAQQALKAVEARYRAGAATWVELSAARNSAVEAEADEVRARYAVLQKGLDIGYQRGDLLDLLQLLTGNEDS